MNLYASILKRPFDLVTSLLLLLALSWLFLLIILSYVVSSQYPIFFKQPRIGFREKVFNLNKFRTLASDDRLPLNQRRFALGDFLRKFSLDELPQLWNVIKGDMSLVGPRPLLVEYGPLFNEEQRERHKVKPGITGWAQVNGRHQISWDDKFRLDLYYIRHISFALDVKILLRTLYIVANTRKDSSLEEKRFEGNA